LSVGKIQALLVLCLGFACWQKPNVLECALALLACCLTVGRYVALAPSRNGMPRPVPNAERSGCFCTRGAERQ